MSHFFALPAKERTIYVQEAAERLNVAPVIVEKDFWVCWMLARLFEEKELSPYLVFKGGTSLSKVFKAIQRFSEDIDLSISPKLLGRDDAFLEGAPTQTQRGKRMKEIERLCAVEVEKHLQPILEKTAPSPGGSADKGPVCTALCRFRGALESSRLWQSMQAP